MKSAAPFALLLLAAAVLAACHDRAAPAARAQGHDDAPVFTLPDEGPPVGWDATFTIAATLHGDEARRGRITWRELEGRLAELTPSPDGLSVRGRTEERALEGAPAWGIVPISPRTRGAHVLEATWTGPDGRRIVRTVRVNAASRATGVSSIARGQEILVAGEGWHVVRTNPKSASFSLERAGAALARFRADVAGQYVLVDRDERPLSIRVNTYEHVPLDCGRGECHPSVVTAAQTSPMTHVLRNGLEGALGPSYAADPSCALACHAVGEPGLPDDGFVAVARAMNASLPAPHAGAWDELPRALRRLGGVGCTSCHGPAAIPEPTARFAILRADVCATCHDAPPRYGHVVAWRTSAMATSDRDPRARSDAACQRCHTTAGFLRTLSSAKREDAPERAGLVGIACAACHAPHDAHGAALVREIAVAPAFAALDAESRVCVPCHDSGAAAVWAGEVPGARAPHAGVGCVACHMRGAPSAPDAHGASHAFRAERGASCRTCHANGVAEDRTLSERASRVLARITGGAVDRARPWHTRVLTPPAGVDSALVRALVAVADDAAASVHNTRFAELTVHAGEARVGAVDQPPSKLGGKP